MNELLIPEAMNALDAGDSSAVSQRWIALGLYLVDFDNVRA